MLASPPRPPKILAAPVPGRLSRQFEALKGRIIADFRTRERFHRAVEERRPVAPIRLKISLRWRVGQWVRAHRGEAVPWLKENALLLWVAVFALGWVFLLLLM